LHTLLAGLVAAVSPPPASAQPATRPAAAAAAPATTRPATTRPGTGGLPPLAEMRAAFDRGEYAKVIGQADRVLRFRGKGAEDYDRHAAAMLKAESHLLLKQFKSAADAFGAAAKLAPADDARAAAAARAMQRVVSETKGAPVRRLAVRPGEPAESADTLDPARREDVLRIFRDNLRADAEPKVSAARRATTIPPITEALDLLWLKMDFEHATAGGTVDADMRTRAELAERIRKLIEAEITRMQGRVDEIWANATTVVGEIETVPRSQYVIAQFQGVTNAERASLRAIMDTCGDVISTVRRLGRAVGTEPERDARLLREATDLRRVADRVRSQKYEDQVVPAAPRRNR
jgi:hypothetical protein